jgi:hypothetical protein
MYAARQTRLREEAKARIGINPIVTFEKQLPNMIGNLA